MENPSGTPLPPRALQPKDWIGPGAILLVIGFFFLLVPGFGGERHLAPLHWLKRSWNHENDFEHGFMVPIITLGLLIWQWKNLRLSVERGNFLGALVAIAGALLFVLAHRTGQARLAIGGLPMILWGAGWFLYGNRIAWQTLFPLFVLWLAVPVPQFQQATMHLQVLSTKLASIGCGWLGIETEVRGTQIFSLSEKWKPLEIDEGCGGIRSLMALILISSVWAYFSNMALWKKALLCAAAFPLAIIGNMLRITSIFALSEMGHAQFAKDTWHDWAGLVIFYPISLFLLLVIHSILEGGMPKWRKLTTERRRVVRSTHAQAG